jgi:hypothetical protein
MGKPKRLSEEHFKILSSESIISSEIAQRANLHTKRQRGKPDAIVFNYYDNESNKIGERLRFYPALRSKDGEDIRYFQKKGSELHCYFLKDRVNQIFDSNEILYITEGEKKLLCLQSISGFESAPIVSFPGCWNWTKAGSNKKLAELWDKIPLENREVVLLPDSDFFLNSNVNAAIKALVENLVDKKAIVSIIDLREIK